jgi:hypothetical protein
VGVVKRGEKKDTKRPRNKKVDVFVEGVVKHGNRTQAAADAGYKQPRMAGSRLMTNDDIRERVERRRAEAMRRAKINTDELIGMLAEVSTSSLSDVLEPDGTFDPAKCIERGTDHLIKKVRKVERHSKDGSKRVTYDYEMYSRMDAIDQLRDTFGMKQEPRPNNYDELKKAEIEKSVNRIMERDKVDKRVAAETLLAELGDSPELIPIINSYVN